MMGRPCRASELPLPNQEHHYGRRYCVLDFETLGQHSGAGTIQLDNCFLARGSWLQSVPW